DGQPPRVVPSRGAPRGAARARPWPAGRLGRGTRLPRVVLAALRGDARPQAGRPLVPLPEGLPRGARGAAVGAPRGVPRRRGGRRRGGLPPGGGDPRVPPERVERLGPSAGRHGAPRARGGAAGAARR